MGHEFCGAVVEKGNEVESLEVGDVVVSPFTVSWYGFWVSFTPARSGF